MMLCTPMRDLMVPGKSQGIGCEVTHLCLVIIMLTCIREKNGAAQQVNDGLMTLCDGLLHEPHHNALEQCVTHEHMHVDHKVLKIGGAKPDRHISMSLIPMKQTVLAYLMETIGNITS